MLSFEKQSTIDGHPDSKFGNELGALHKFEISTHCSNYSLLRTVLHFNFKLMCYISFLFVWDTVLHAKCGTKVRLAL